MKKTRIILINYNGPPAELYYFYPDNGLSLLASFLLAHGHEPLILDYVSTDMCKRLYRQEMTQMLKEIRRLHYMPQTIDVISMMVEIKKEINKIIEEEEYRISMEIIEYIKTFKPSIIGFKLWETYGFSGSISFAREVKKAFPHIVTVGGGPQVDAYKSLIMEYTDVFDFLIYGEGEIALTELINYTSGKGSLKDIPNLIYRDGNEIRVNQRELIYNVDELPWSIYDEHIYPAMEGDKKLKVFLIESARGCPNKCNFCLHSEKSGSQWRTRNPAVVVNQMEEIINKHSSNMFRLADSSPPPGSITAIGKEIINRKLDITFSAFGHAKSYPHEDFKLMKEAGCCAVMYGIESGSQHILDYGIGKGISVEESRNVLKATKEAGIYTIANVIIPSPFETDETINETMKLLFDTRPDSVIVHIPVLMLSTPWWDNPEKYNISLRNKKNVAIKLMTRISSVLLPQILWDKFPYKINGLGDKEMFKLVEKANIKLIQNNICNGITDYSALLAMGTGHDVMDLTNKSLNHIEDGNIEELMDMVCSLNKKIKEKVDSE